MTWVTPRHELSNHPPYSTIWAQNWATIVINAVMRSPMWRSTAIFVTWDEGGGTYDPVPAPRVEQLGLGIRVPMLVISPWANPRHDRPRGRRVLLAAQAHRGQLGLDYLSDRVRNTHNFEHVFDFKRKASELLPPDPLRCLVPGPLPAVPPLQNVGWPPAMTAPVCA